MNDKLFGLSNPFDDAKKLDREYRRLSNSNNGESKQDKIDHALNFSLTAWHIADKVYNYPDTQRVLKEKGIDNWKIYHKHVFNLCPELNICYDFSIKYKHSTDTSTKTIKSASQVLVTGISKINGVPIDQIAEINGIPIAQIAKINGVAITQDRLIVELTDGKKLNFIDIANTVNKFWQKELESFRT